MPWGQIVTERGSGSVRAVVCRNGEIKQISLILNSAVSTTHTGCPARRDLCNAHLNHASRGWLSGLALFDRSEGVRLF